MKTNLLLLGMLLWSFNSFSIQKKWIDNIYFDHFSNEDGLSHSTIFDIKQDHLGYIWIATANGLNRYDGNRFTTFKKEIKNPNSLLENEISSLYIDSENQLWIGSKKGLSCLNESRSRFTNYPLQSQATFGNIHAITEINKSEYLIGSNRGLFLFSKKTGFVKLETNLSTTIFHCFINYQERLIVGSVLGIHYYDHEHQTLLPVDDNLPEANVNDLLYFDQTKEKLWIATEDKGLLLYNIKDRTYKQYRKGVLSSDNIRTLSYDNNQMLWIGTYNGVNIYDRDTDQFFQLSTQNDKEGSISQNSARQLLLDNQGGIWCGTFFGGINYYHPLKRQIKHFKNNPAHPQETLSENIVSAFGEDSKGRIWIGTNDGGINLFDPKTNHFTPPSKVQSLNISSVKAFQKTADGTLWIGSYREGLFRCDHNKTSITRVPLSDFFSDSQIYSLASMGDTLFIGCVTGVHCYNTTTKRFTQLTSNDKQTATKVCNVLHIDQQKRLWIGTIDGYTCYDIPKAMFINSVPELQKEGFENVNSFEQDSHGRIWIGTNNSLICLNPDLSKNETKSSSFTGTAIYSILHDTNSRLWISTNEGLYTLNLLSMQKILYTTADGAQGSQFIRNSKFRTTTGQFYFGGINGFNLLSPELIIDNPYTPTPIIESVSLFNQRILPENDFGVIYKQDEKSGIKEIRIPGQYPYFSVQFAVTNYLSGKNNNLFAYQLEGHDKEWLQTRTGEITYTGLPPGEYRLLIKCANSSRIWNNHPTKLRLIVLPQWFQTWWARLIFSLLIGSLLYIGGRIFLNRKLMAQKLILEQEKLQMFINISHEFRTPLSMIISPLEELLRRGLKEKWLHKQISLIYRNAVQMLELVNHTLDYRRAEMGALEFKVSEGNIFHSLEKIGLLFASSCERKGIILTIRPTNLPEKLLFSSSYIERIVTNLLSNALKFTPQGGSITLSASTSETRLIIQIQDTGCGIPKEKLPNIFNRFYQVESNAQGSGIGLSFVLTLIRKYRGEIEVESEVSQGSCFTIKLPFRPEQFQKEELSAPSTHEVEGLRSSLNQAEQLIETSFQDYQPTGENETITEQIEGIEIRSRNILIVEDNPDIRQYLCDNLANRHQIQTAENGKLGWGIVKKTPDLDLIISDVMMPEMDGIELCKLVKQNIHYCHIPLFLLTAKSEIKDQLRGITLGADDYIAKPFIMAILEAKIENIFKQRSRLINRYASNREVTAEEVTTNPLDAKLLSKATQIVMQQMSDSNFSVEHLGREIGMSRSNLHSKIKSITGDTAIEFIRRIRLNEAMRLLHQGEMTILEISTFIGFSPSYLSTSFKKFTGMLPREYQELHGGKKR